MWNWEHKHDHSNTRFPTFQLGSGALVHPNFIPGLGARGVEPLGPIASWQRTSIAVWFAGRPHLTGFSGLKWVTYPKSPPGPASYPRRARSMIPVTHIHPRLFFVRAESDINKGNCDGSSKLPQVAGKGDFVESIPLGHPDACRGKERPRWRGQKQKGGSIKYDGMQWCHSSWASKNQTLFLAKGKE